MSQARIVALDSFDIRFPASIQHDRSDAMNPDPDYSAAYAILRTCVAATFRMALPGSSWAADTHNQLRRWEQELWPGS